MSAMKSSPNRQHTSSWSCSNCLGTAHSLESATFKEMATHVELCHGFNPIGMKCKRSLIMALDGDGFYQNTHDVTLNQDGKEVNLVCCSSGPARSYDDENA